MRKTWQVAWFLAALLVSSALGQNNRGDTVTNIPFAFTVTNHTLPAGRYTVTRMSETALGIFNVHHQGTIVLTHEIEGEADGSTARIVFHRYGNAYFLSEVWLAARATGRKAFPTSAERELAATETGSELAVLLIGDSRPGNRMGQRREKKSRW